MTRRQFVVAAVAAAAGPGRAFAQHDRYAEIRHLIKKNLHFSGHMTWSVNTQTIDAVRPHVTSADIPVLLRMLGDSENVVGIGAQYVLAALGSPAIPGLETAAKSADYRVATKAREALDYMAQQKKP